MREGYTAEQAVSGAEARGQPSLAAEVRRHLALYREGRPYLSPGAPASK